MSSAPPAASSAAAAVVPAADATTMAEVRTAIDDLDQQIVTLLGKRLRYIEAASRIKTERNTVRDEWRKQDVIEKAVQRAHEVEFPEGLVREIYEVLVEGSIGYEMVKWDATKG